LSSFCTSYTFASFARGACYSQYYLGLGLKSNGCVLW
jgi:hypothetical protein